MNWITNYVRPKINSMLGRRTDMPENLWIKDPETGEMVFAKLKGRSSTFRHLCTQAVASADLLFREQDARELLLEKVAEATRSETIHTAVIIRLSDLENRRPGSLKLCLLLLGTW